MRLSTFSTLRRDLEQVEVPVVNKNVSLTTVGAKSVFCRRRKVSDFQLLYLGSYVDETKMRRFREFAQPVQDFS
jgi:hypothetical protein